MIEAVMNLLLLAVAAAVTVLWIIALAESDGRCHLDDCQGCPFAGDCPEDRRKG